MYTIDEVMEEYDDRSGSNIVIFFGRGSKIVVATHSEWWYVE